MANLLRDLFLKVRNLGNREEGQNLVEYALVVGLIAFGATAGMNSLAAGLNSTFSTMSTTLSNSISVIL